MPEGEHHFGGIVHPLPEAKYMPGNPLARIEITINADSRYATVELNYEDPEDAVKFITGIMGHVAVILEKD